MKLNIKVPKFNLLNTGLILTLILIFLIVFEVYLVYGEVYQKLVANPEIIQETNIVRVNLEDYNNSISLIKKLETYSPPPLFLNRFNPFN